jgi:excisionase family DNA binding protein
MKHLPNAIGKSYPIYRDYMTIDELSMYLGLSKSAIYKKVFKRKIPHYKQGLLFFKKSEIQVWIEQGKVETI